MTPRQYRNWRRRRITILSQNIINTIEYCNIKIEMWRLYLQQNQGQLIQNPGILLIMLAGFGADIRKQIWSIDQYLRKLSDLQEYL